MKTLRTQRSSSVFAALLWIASVVIAGAPLLGGGNMHPARLLSVVTAAGAVVLTARGWILRAQMPAERAYQLGYRAGLSDGAHAATAGETVVDLRAGRARRPVKVLPIAEAERVPWPPAEPLEKPG